MDAKFLQLFSAKLGDASRKAFGEAIDLDSAGNKEAAMILQTASVVCGMISTATSETLDQLAKEPK